MQTTELTGLSRQAIARWHDLFREHLPKDHVVLGKIVQLDEAYFKGWSLVMGKEKGTRKIAFMMWKTSVERHHAVQFLDGTEARIHSLHGWRIGLPRDQALVAGRARVGYPQAVRIREDSEYRGYVRDSTHLHPQDVPSRDA